MLVTENVAENEQRIAAGIERAAGDRSHFLVTPEGALSGYYADFDRAEVASAVERVAAMAKKAGIGLALGTCYKELDAGEELCYNQVRVYTPEGDYRGFYAKILRCSSLWHPGTGEMCDYVEGTLKTFEWNGVRFGILICNDLHVTPGYTTMPNPYLAWRLQQMGAKFILHSLNTGDDQSYRAFHECSSDLWARALHLPIVQVNAAAADGVPVNASSVAIDAEGKRYVTAPDCGEQYFICDLLLD